MLNTDDIQALVFSSHVSLPHALACRLTIHDRRAAKQGLRSIIEELSYGFRRWPQSPPRAVQLALSASGIRALAGEDAVANLGRPFREGIATAQRSRALGDRGRNDPQNWLWRDDQTHALLLVYAEDASTANTQADHLMRTLSNAWQHGGNEAIRIPASGREPFGFRDGMSKVRLDIGDGMPPPAGTASVPPEEILLHFQPGGQHALALNSAYVVIRQLEQDVASFWRFWRERSGTEEEAVWLAAKAVGRWPNGMPVSGTAPIPEPPANEQIIDSMLSFRDDSRGDACPFGAHIRRANPRDGLRLDPELSLRLVSSRRIIRRGRVYGPPAPADYYPGPLQPELADPQARMNGERGLLFLALCADIVGQFEFIQQTWLNNPKHADLYDEVDPIAAGDGIEGDQRHFTIPRDPLRRRITGHQPWITVRAGGYFILPGRTALQHLASD